MNDSKKERLDLASTSWPRFRANKGSTGKSSFSGPKGNEIKWKVKVGALNGEVIVGLDDSLYLALESDELLSLNFEGEEKWKKGILKRDGSPFYAITPPLVREDGSLIVGATARIQCLEQNGDVRWEKFIDGLPSSPNIGIQGLIYIPAWSIDWAGVYVVSSDGKSHGKDDPRLTKVWRINRHVQVSPAAIDNLGNIYVAYRANITHPEAYTWDPPDEVDEDFFYECVFFDYLGEKLGNFLSECYESGILHQTSVCVDNEDLIYYLGGGFGFMSAFKRKDIINLKIPKDYDWIGWDGDTDYNEAANFAYSMLEKCMWTWDRLKDKDPLGNYGIVFGFRPVGYPVISENDRIWLRLHERDHNPSKFVLEIDTSELKKNDNLIYRAQQFSGRINADPIIDGNGFIYIGTLDGNIFILNSEGIQLKTIKLGHPISSMIIGPKESLITTTMDGYICLIQ